jgi:hypothetical protein
MTSVLIQERQKEIIQREEKATKEGETERLRQS